MKWLAILLFTITLVAQDQPKALDPKTQEIHILRLRESLKNALLFQAAQQKADQDSKDAQQRFQKSVGDYNDTVKAEAKDLGFPDGTTFNVNTETGVVIPVIPQKKASAVPAPPPASAKPAN